MNVAILTDSSDVSECGYINLFSKSLVKLCFHCKRRDVTAVLKLPLLPSALIQ